MLQVIGSIHKGIRAVFEHAYCAIAPVAQQAPDCTSGVAVIGGQSPWVPVRSYGSLRLFADRAYLVLLFHKPVVMLGRHTKALLSYIVSMLLVYLISIVSPIARLLICVARLAPSLNTIISRLVFVKLSSWFFRKTVSAYLIVWVGCNSNLSYLTVPSTVFARLPLCGNEHTISDSVAFRHLCFLSAPTLAVSKLYFLFHRIILKSSLYALAYRTMYYSSTTIEV